MDSRGAWSTFSLMVVLAIAVAASLLFDLGYDPLLIVLISLVILSMYVYVIYKRYHVEIVPESDLQLFDDPQDLKILSSIYGLDTNGTESELKARLTAFVRGNKDKAFTWIAPGAVLYFGSRFELGPSEPRSTGAGKLDKPLVGGRPRSGTRLAGIRACPLCGAVTSGESRVCPECGVDLEFYAVLAETKIGRRLLSEKNVAVRRKLRYQVSSLGGDR